MKQILLFTIGMFLLVATASAQTASLGTAGTIYTQKQVDDFDFSKVSLNCSASSTNINLFALRVEQTFKCLYVKPQTNIDTGKETGSYELEFRYMTKHYSLLNYGNCRLAKTKTDCVNELKTSLIEQFEKEKSVFRSQMIKLQTKTDLTKSDISFTSGELNR